MDHLPPDKILADKDKLAAYDAWLEANGRGGSHDDAFGQRTVDLATASRAPSRAPWTATAPTTDLEGRRPGVTGGEGRRPVPHPRGVPARCACGLRPWTRLKAALSANGLP